MSAEEKTVRAMTHGSLRKMQMKTAPQNWIAQTGEKRLKKTETKSVKRRQEHKGNHALLN
jgi:hypothetical protein